MKARIFPTISLIGAVYLATENQPAAAPVPAPPPMPAAPAIRPQPAQPLTPVPGSTPNQQPAPNTPTPVGPGPTGFVSNLNQQVPTVTNQFGGTNGFNTNTVPFAGTNQSTTNRIGGPTDQSFGTNQFAAFSNSIFATNRFGTNDLIRDQAATDQDRQLIVKIRQWLLVEIQQSRSPVHLIVNMGVVTLVGFASSPQESQLIANIVRGTPGVANVTDNLQINPSVHAGQQTAGQDIGFTDNDREFVHHVRREFDRRWHRDHDRDDDGDRFNEGGPLSLFAQNGVITLRGTVSSFQEEQSIISAVEGIPGVNGVRNELIISHEPAGTTGSSGTTSTNGLTAGGGMGTPGGGFPFRGRTNGVPDLRNFGTNIAPTSRTNAPPRVYHNSTNQ